MATASKDHDVTLFQDQRTLIQEFDMSIILARFCTICMTQDKAVPATNIATDVEGLQWYECDNHGPDDYRHAFETELPRLKLESARAFFDRHFKDADKTPNDLEPPDKPL